MAHQHRRHFLILWSAPAGPLPVRLRLPYYHASRWLKDFDAPKYFKLEVRQKILWKNGQQLLAHTAVTHMHFSSSRDCLLALRQPCSTCNRETSSGMFAQPFRLGYTLSRPRHADGQYSALKNTLTSCLERLLAEGDPCSRQQKAWGVLDYAAPQHSAHV